MGDVITSGLKNEPAYIPYVAPPGMPKDYFENFLKRDNGLRGLETEIGKNNFLNVLAECMKNKELSIYTDVFFDSYTNDSTIVPVDLYLCGYGQHLEQSLEEIPRVLLNFCKHLTFLDRPHFDTESKVFYPDHQFSHYIYNPDNLVQPWKGRPLKKFENPVKYIDSDIFLTNLTTSYTCNMQARYFEGWIYALTALSQNRMVPLYSLRSAVYYQLAISSANLALSSKVTWRSLAEATRVQYHPTQKWEWICAAVQVLVAFGLFEKEEYVFKTGIKMIPESSSWYQVLLFHHLRGIQYQIENIFIKTIILNNMSQDIVYEADLLVQLRQLNLKLSFQSEKLSDRGLEYYFKGFSYLYNFMMSQRHGRKKRFLELAKLKLKAAYKTLDIQEMKRDESIIILDYLDKCIINLDEVCEIFLKFTRCENSIPTSDCLVRMALLDLFGGSTFKTKYLDNQEIIRRAELDYEKVTQGRGYRCEHLRYLNRFRSEYRVNAEEQGRIMHMIDTAPNLWLQDIHYEVGSREPRTQELVDENIFTQTAYMGGWHIATDGGEE